MGIEMVAATMIGGAMQADNARSAARSQERASKDANAVQLQMFNQQRQDQEPWRQVGIRALAGLEDPSFQKDFSVIDMKSDDGFNFRMNEGVKAINNAASARGLSNSGRTLKELTRFGQDFASNEYQNAFNRFNINRDFRRNHLASMAGLGQTANAQVGQAGQNYANQASNNMLMAGNARSAGQIGAGNAISNMIGTGVNLYQQNQFMNQLKNLIPQQSPGGMSVANAGGGFGMQMVPGDY